VGVKRPALNRQGGGGEQPLGKCIYDRGKEKGYTMVEGGIGTTLKVWPP